MTPQQPHDGHGHREHGHSHGNDVGQDHGHGHGHHHAPADFGSAFAIGTALNITFVIVEAAYGYWANSVALIADAGHNLSDVAGLLMAWGASVLGKQRASARYTYGLGATTILAALANAVLLLVAVGAIIWEALGRFAKPESVNAETVIWIAALGIVINAATAWLFSAGRHHDINVRGAFLHMAADAAVSLGVVLAGIAILVTGWLWLDPLISIAIALIIVWGTWGLLKDSVHLAIGGVPPAIDAAAVRHALEDLPGVSNVHDLHIWPTSTTSAALTAHLVLRDGHPGDAFLVSAAHMLEERFRIAHATLQIERGDGGSCALRCDGGQSPG
jgi:cobalt-zinc-cadmium efflux system protein